MYPRGSPKFNLMQANAIARKALLGTKKPSPKTKRASPRGTCVGGKSRAQWNPGLEKGLVELLHEHNTPYHRGQNGWGSETWNLMTKIFHTRYGHTNFTKHQIQEKEKELKRDYRILKEARKQSGAGWNMHTCMKEADPHLWDNLITVSCFPICSLLCLVHPCFSNPRLSIHYFTLAIYSHGQKSANSRPKHSLSLIY